MSPLYPIRVFFSWKEAESAVLDTLQKDGYAIDPTFLEEDEDLIPHRGYDEEFDEDWEDEDYDYDGIAYYSADEEY